MTPSRQQKPRPKRSQGMLAMLSNGPRERLSLKPDKAAAPPKAPAAPAAPASAPATPAKRPYDHASCIREWQLTDGRAVALHKHSVMLVTPLRDDPDNS